MLWVFLMAAGPGRWSFDFDRPEVRSQGEYSVIPGPDNWSADSGAPLIPAYDKLIILPPGMTAVGLRARGSGGEVILRDVRLAPSQGAVKIGDKKPIAESPEYYSRRGELPGVLAELTGVDWFGGQRVAELRLYPVQYSPQEGTVRFYNRIDVDLELAPAPSRGTAPKHSTKLGNLVRKEMAGGILVNPGDLLLPPEISGGPLPDVNVRPQDLSAGVDYLVITSPQLLPGFSEFIFYKNLMGIRTAAATTDWISTHYEGVDLQEKIRKYIKDAYQEWGVVWVLLGGSVEHVPTRYVETGVNNESIVPCDWYYSCLDGNWNADRDEVFGEPYVDSVDYLPEVWIGRAYAKDLDQADLFGRKFYQYQFSPGVNIKRALFVGPQLWDYDPTSGERVCEAIQKQFPSDFQYIEFYERFGNIRLDTIIPELYRGVGCWVSISHGAFDRLYMDDFTISLADTLSNWDHMPVTTIISCLAGAFDKDALTTHMVAAPGGGFIAVKSVARNGYVLCQAFDTTFYGALFSHPEWGLGGHDAASRVALAPAAQGVSLIRYLYLSYALLGDPGLFPWADNPHYFVVSGPAGLSVGPASFTVNVKNGSGFYVPGARVVLYKQNEIYEVRETDGLGNAQFDVNIPSSGPMFLGVHKPGYVPYVDTLDVGASGPWLTVLSATPKDFDGDGYPEPAETLSLAYTVKNGGTSPASGAVARLRTTSPYITVVDSEMSLPFLAPNASARVQGFSMVVSAPPPGGQAHVVLDLLFLTPDTAGKDTAGFDVYAPVMERWVRNLSVDTVSLMVRFVPGLANKGWADAENLSMHLFTSSPGITILDGDISVNHVDKRGWWRPQDVSESFSFRISDPNALGGATLSVELRDPMGVLDTLNYVFRDDIPAPGGLWGVPDSASVNLMWEAPGDYNPYGYLVYRSENITGPYELVSYDPPDMSQYTDYTVAPHKIYYYKVAAIDSFYNPGPWSDPVMLATYLRKDSPWPKLVPGAYITSPIMCDLDPSYPGTEMVVASRDAPVQLYAFHYDGTLVDGWPVVISTADTVSEWNEMAAGDIDGDGYPEIALRLFKSNDLYVIRHDGSFAPGWPKSVGWVAGLGLCPTMADLDGDGKLEILFSQGDIVYAFRYDGTGFLDPSGILFRHPLGGGGFGSVSVADIDHDGQLEIVAGYRLSPSSEIWALKADGTVMPGFPARLDDQADIGPAVAVGDMIPNISGDEIVALASRGDVGSMWCVDATGNVVWSVGSMSFMYIYSAVPSLGDVNNDGVPEALAVGSYRIYAVDGGGNLLEAHSVVTEWAGYTSVTTCDLDGDGKNEYFSGDYNGNLLAYRDGAYVLGFPVPLGIYNMAVPQIGDFDGDGLGEVVQLNTNGYVYALEMYQGPPSWSDLDWKTYKHDNWRTGWLGADSVMPRGRFFAAQHDAPKVSWGPTLNRGRARVALNLETTTRVVLKVYDPTGRLVETPFAGRLGPGEHALDWGQNLASGVYFLRLELDDEVLKTKSVKLR